MTPSPGLLPWLATFTMHSVLLCAAAFVVTRYVRSPRGREVIWKGALLGAFATSALQGWIGRSAVLMVEVPVAEAAPQQAPGRVIALAGSGAALTSEVLPAEPVLAAPSEVPTAAAANEQTWIWWLLAGWAAIAAARLALLARDQWRVQRAFAGRRPVLDERPRRMIEALLDDPRRAARIQLSVQAGLEGPLALGLREIVLPERYEWLDDGELEGLLAHELAHLVRRDPLWSLLAHTLERAFFPQVLLRGVRRRLVADAELCADDWAARRMGQPIDLARCLATVAGWIGDRDQREVPAMAAGMGSSKSALVERVERLLEPGRRDRGGRTLAAIAVTGALGVVAWAGPIVLADDGDELRLELIEIERVGDADGGRLLYTLEKLETTRLERVAQSLEASIQAREISQVALDLGAGVAAVEVEPLLAQLAHYGFDRPLVVGRGDRAQELRRRIVARGPWVLHVDVVEPGMRLDPETGEDWSGQGRWRYDDSRVVRYRVGDGGQVTLAGVTAILRGRAGVPVIVDPHAGTLYQDIVTLLDGLTAAGFEDISFRSASNDLIGGSLGREAQAGDVLRSPGAQMPVDGAEPVVTGRVSKDRRSVEAADPESLDALRGLGYVGAGDPEAGGGADPEAIDALRGLGYAGDDEPEAEPAGAAGGSGATRADGFGGPSTPGPSGPSRAGGGASTPGPAGPSRPRGRGPSTPGPAGPSRPAGGGTAGGAGVHQGPPGPSAPAAGSQEPPPGPVAPSRPRKKVDEIRIDSSGAIRVGETLLVDPQLVAGLEDPYAPLKARLAQIARGMHRSEELRKAGRMSLADGPLVLRGEEHTNFVHVQRLMEACGSPDVLIWRVFLAEGDGSPMAAHLPTEAEVGQATEELEDGVVVAETEPVERVEILLRVRSAGTKVDPRTGGPWSGAGPFAYEGRVIQYAIGPYKTQSLTEFQKKLEQVRHHANRKVQLDPRAGVTMGEVLQVMRMTEELAFPGILFVGAYGAPANDYSVEDR